MLEVSLASRNVCSNLLPTLSSRKNGTLLEAPLGLPQEQMDSDTNVLLFSIQYDTLVNACLRQRSERKYIPIPIPPTFSLNFPIKARKKPTSERRGN